jgi:hypothetical protein
LLAFLAVVATGRAHAADEVLQVTTVELQPTGFTITVSLLGGSESYRALQYELDQRGDPELSDAEIGAWLRGVWLPAMAFEIDNGPVPIDPSQVEAAFGGPPKEMFLNNPLVLTVRIPVPPDGKAHRLTVRNDYAQEHAEYRLELLTAPGTEASVTDDSARDWSISFKTDPASPGGTAILASLTVAGGSGSASILDLLRDNAVWIVAVLIVVGVVGWLVLARLQDQAAARLAKPVRQSQASRKKPVAVRTIDAPDE